jgi:hypothetical protein
MSRRPARRRGRLLGMTGRKPGIVALLLVTLLLVIGVMLGFAIGFFDGILTPTAAPPAQGQIPPTTGVELTRTPDITSEPGSEASPVSGTATAITFETPPQATPSGTSAARTTPTITNTATITTTPQADVCSQLSLRYLGATSNVVTWRLQNASGIDLELTRAQLDWPQSNDAIFNVFLNGTAIWSSQDFVPPTVIGSWIGTTTDRMVNGVVRLEFFFGISAAESGYNLRLWFGNGCQVS